MAEMDQMVRVYVDEARELLEELERSLLELEKDPADQDRLAACFRVMHTLKGGAGMFGFEEIARLTHDVETIYDLVRGGKLGLSEDLLNLTFQARDHILTLLETPSEDLDSQARQVTDGLIARFRVYLPTPDQGGAAGTALDLGDAPAAREPAPPSETTGPEAATEEEERAGVYWVRFRPDPTILETGNEPLRLLAELATKGLFRSRRSGAMPPLDDPDYDPERVYGFFDVLLVTTQDAYALRDVFLFVEDNCSLRLVKVRDDRLRGSDLDDLLKLTAGVEDDETAERDLTRGVEKLSRHIQAAKARMRAKADQDAGQASAKADQGKKAEPGGTSSLRVDAAKLDTMVNLAGELVILQSRLRQAVRGGNMEDVAAVDEDLERLTDDMREVSLGLRMLPVGTVFNTFQRLVRDLSHSLAKEVDFHTVGGETEVDKTILDQLKDPLVHILRNSLDHGVESPQEREDAGKPRRGAITLSASHGGGFVEIVVADNGRGVDTEAVRRKAVERGLLAPDAEPTEKELLALLFAPGFSTAKKISDVSGRGVGMDVVMRNITGLRGTVDIETQKGAGSRVVIRLPLTLAIIDGFNVTVGRESFIVPLSHLRGFQERFVLDEVHKLDTIEHMGELIPLVSLRRLFGIPGAQPEYERIVVTEVDGERVGFCVDKVIGRQQAVIKSLDECYRNITWISGTTINGDGSISLILDIPRLIRMARDTV